jgi:hypothetical protein
MVAVVLAIVVWIGVAGRSPAAVTAPTPPGVARGELTASATPEPTIADPDDIFGVSLVIGLNGHHAIMDEPEPGHLTGVLRVYLPLAARTDGTLIFQQFSSPSAPGRPSRLGSGL